MDKCKQYSSTEGCSSNESGWTMYIDSPMQEDDGDCTEESHEHNHHQRANECDSEQNSDDSMASDASSGPSHHQNEHKYSRDSRIKRDYFHKYASRRDSKKDEKTAVENNKNKRGFGGNGKHRK